MTPGNGRTSVSMMPRTGRALLWAAFPFVVVACSAACLPKAADPASGVTPAADPPAVLPPPIAGRAAISPAAPILPGETVAALQDGNHEAARGALVKLRENANAPGDRAGLRAVGVQPPVANPAGGQDLPAKPGNNLKQIQRLQERYKSPESDKAKGAPAGQFR